jgi:uncharacterized protein (TIGR02246 family)
MKEWVRRLVATGCAAVVGVAVACGRGEVAEVSSSPQPVEDGKATHASCAAEMATVRTLAERVIPEAWARGDAKTVAAAFTPDTTFVVPGTLIRGRDELQNYLEKAFLGPAKGTNVKEEIVSARCVSPDVAVLVGTGGQMMSGETNVPAERIGVQTWTIIKDGERWLVAAYANARSA